MNTVLLTGFGYEAEICPERGANLIALRRPELGMDALRTPSSIDDFASNPYLWGTPMLFLPNRISGAAFSFEGREYRFPVNEPELGNFLHGTLHETPMRVVAQGEGCAEFAYRATDARPYLTFPHAFELRVQYELTREGARQRATLLNLSNRNMPVALGFHTTFAIPFASGGRAEDVRLRLGVQQEFLRDARTYLPTGEALDAFKQREALLGEGIVPGAHSLSRLFSMDGTRKMALEDAAKGVRVVYRADARYGFWMVYNAGRRDLLCVEPQTWLSNCPNAPFDREAMGFDFLAPGEARAYTTTLALEKIENTG